MIVKSKKRIELVNITSGVQSAVSKAGVKNGTCTVFCPHSTAGLIINEDEPGLKQDILKKLEAIAPPSGYKHNRIGNNADSHLKSMIVGPSKSVPVGNGKLSLGAWQSIFFAEFDGPRPRRVLVSVVPVGQRSPA